LQAFLREPHIGRVEFSTRGFWPMEYSEFVDALANGRL
jgi:hypothetical protein